MMCWEFLIGVAVVAFRYGSLFLVMAWTLHPGCFLYVIASPGWRGAACEMLEMQEGLILSLSSVKVWQSCRLCIRMVSCEGVGRGGSLTAVSSRSLFFLRNIPTHLLQSLFPVSRVGILHGWGGIVALYTSQSGWNTSLTFLTFSGDINHHYRHLLISALFGVV